MTTNQPYSKTTYLVLCGLFTAIVAACSYITIPLPFSPVPMNMGTLGVFLSGGLLGRKYSTVSIAVYLLLGAVGIPVFAGFQAGLGVLAGPTGGYLIGYLVAAFVIGHLLETRESRKSESNNLPKNQLRLCISAMLIGLLICYTLGTIWFMLLMGTNLWSSLLICVAPFIPGDIIKIFAGALLVKRLRPLIF